MPSQTRANPSYPTLKILHWCRATLMLSLLSYFLLSVPFAYAQDSTQNDNAQITTDDKKAVGQKVMGQDALMDITDAKAAELLFGEGGEPDYKTPLIERHSNGSKKLLFLGVMHVAPREMYDKTIAEIKRAKSDGYILFYEEPDHSNTTDREMRKIRKLFGFVPSMENHKKLNDADGVTGEVAQDTNEFLGLINDKDYRADVTLTELIKLYEDAHGTIQLTKEDLETPLDEIISEAATLEAEKTIPIIMGERNKLVATAIHESTHDKIVVVYGEAHYHGILEILKTLDPTWQ